MCAQLENSLDFPPSTFSPVYVNPHESKTRRRRSSSRQFDRSDFVDSITLTNIRERRKSDSSIYSEYYITKMPNSNIKTHKKHPPNIQVNDDFLQVENNFDNYLIRPNGPMSCPSKKPVDDWFAEVSSPKKMIPRKAIKPKHFFIDEFDDVEEIEQEENVDENDVNIKKWESSPRKHKLRIRNNNKDIQYS